MTGFFDKLKGSKSSKGSQGQGQGSGPASEPTYSIQPHPATTNNPADLQGGGPTGGQGGQDGQEGGGLATARDPAFALHQSTPGIVIPEGLANVPVENEDQLKARAAELNKDK